MLNPETLAERILAGDVPASDAMGRADAYDALNAGANGPLPFLGTSTKIEASNGAGYLTKVLYLMAANASGREACAYRSPGCSAACLVEFTGRMSMDAARTARRRRHASFFADRGRFMADLAAEVDAFQRYGARKGKSVAVRLNGTSDLPFERMPVVWNGTRYASLMEAFPTVQFYDYTKVPLAKRGKRGQLPANYHLTYSLSERPDAEDTAGAYLDAGYPVAVVFQAAKGNLPNAYALAGRVRIVTDADKHDARFTDAPGTIAGLSAKGRAKSDESGFVRAA